MLAGIVLRVSGGNVCKPIYSLAAGLLWQNSDVLRSLRNGGCRTVHPGNFVMPSKSVQLFVGMPEKTGEQTESPGE